MTFREALLLSPSLTSLDREVLLAHCLGKSREYLLAHPNELLKPRVLSMYRRLLEKRSASSPVAYLTGKKEFFGFPFLVTNNTLIPRPETELLVEEALATLRTLPRTFHHQRILALDVGTGSGNILLSLLASFEATRQHFPDIRLRGIGLDRSAKALAIARKNARSLKIRSPHVFLESDLLANLPSHTVNQAKAILLLANLPYLSSKLYRSAPKDVRHYEPKTALYSPSHGLEHYERLFRQIVLLKRQSPRLPIHLLIEFSPEQRRALTTLLHASFPASSPRFLRDLARKYRVLECLL